MGPFRIPGAIPVRPGIHALRWSCCSQICSSWSDLISPVNSAPEPRTEPPENFPLKSMPRPRYLLQNFVSCCSVWWSYWSQCKRSMTRALLGHGGANALQAYRSGEKCFRLSEEAPWLPMSVCSWPSRRFSRNEGFDSLRAWFYLQLLNFKCSISFPI